MFGVIGRLGEDRNGFEVSLGCVVRVCECLVLFCFWEVIVSLFFYYKLKMILVFFRFVVEFKIE